MTITKELARDIRAAFGLKIPEMAELVGVSKRQWSRYEDGTTPVPATVQKLLVYLMRERSNAAAR